MHLRQRFAFTNYVNDKKIFDAGVVYAYKEKAFES